MGKRQTYKIEKSPELQRKGLLTNEIKKIKIKLGETI